MKHCGPGSPYTASLAMLITTLHSVLDRSARLGIALTNGGCVPSMASSTKHFPFPASIASVAPGFSLSQQLVILELFSRRQGWRLQSGE